MLSGITRSRLASQLLAGVVLLTLAGTVAAQEDHPLVSRYEGSTLFRSRVFEYTDFVIITAPGTTSEPSLKAPQKLEGKLSQYYYISPENRAPLEILRNYQASLQQAGFKTLTECANQACGGNFFNVFWSTGTGNKRFLLDNTALDANMSSRYGRDTRFYIAQASRGGATYTVVLQVGTINNSWLRELNTTDGRSIIGLTVIESKAMDTGKVTVDAAYMGKEIKETGRVVLYNIYFDTNSATLKPESDAALEEIRKLLAQNPSQRLLVVGHTDNQGTVEFNYDLSKRRAAAVVDALVKRYGIAATRLSPQGAGRIAPVAANNTEEGRARNRRVELVEW